MKWSELNENIPSNADMGVLMPKNMSGWFIVFTYQDSGHIADDEKGELDAAAILETLRQGNNAANEERRRRGWAPLDLVGWQVPPAYEDATHHLVWALRVSSEGQESINYNTRILGRTGVMSANLDRRPRQVRGRHCSQQAASGRLPVHGRQQILGMEDRRQDCPVRTDGADYRRLGGRRCQDRPLGQARRDDRQVRQSDHHRHPRPRGRNCQVLPQHLRRQKQGLDRKHLAENAVSSHGHRVGDDRRGGDLPLRVRVLGASRGDLSLHGARAIPRLAFAVVHGQRAIQARHRQPLAAGPMFRVRTVADRHLARRNLLA